MVCNSSEYMKKYYQKNKDKYAVGGSYKKLAHCELCNKDTTSITRHNKSKMHITNLKLEKVKEKEKEEFEKQVRKLVKRILKEYDLI